jgi:uncharacterized membrane protein YbaN (DUF454 family)
VVTASLGKPSATGDVFRGANDGAAHCPPVQIDEGASSIRVRDPRIIRAGQRAFCRRLVESLARQHGVLKAEIDLASATCHVEFGPRSTTSQSMANDFADSVREAAGSQSIGKPFSRWPLGGTWLKLTAYPLQDGVSVWETLGVHPGWMRIRNQRLVAGNSRGWQLAEALADLDGVANCHANSWSGALNINFHPESLLADRLLDEVQPLLEDLVAAEACHHGPAERAAAGGEPRLATGSERIVNLALAGGSFAMTGVALVVPGIPFLPFLLATSYYLARSSPRMNQRLHRLPLIGAILIEWEQYHRLSRLSKLRLVGLTLVVILFSIVLIGLSPAALVVMFLISSAMIFGILHAPEIGDSPRSGLPVEKSPSLALPAP